MASIGSKEKLRRYLRAKVGIVVSAAELQEAAGGTVEWARRLRELRSDEGWKISSHRDRTDLKPGQYRLEEPPPEPGEYQFSKPMSAKLRALVLERNGYTCMMCGIGAGELDETGRKAVLRVEHIVDKSHGGKDELPNLRALCARCSESASNIAQEPPSYTMLLAQVRRASNSDQRFILDWLKQNYGE